MTRLSYDPDEPFSVRLREPDGTVTTATVRLPAPGFTATAVVDFWWRDRDGSLVDIDPSDGVAADDPEHAHVALGAFERRHAIPADGEIDESGDAVTDRIGQTEEPAERYRGLRRRGRRVATTPGVPSFLVTDSQLPFPEPSRLLRVRVHGSLLDGDDDEFGRPPGRGAADEWTDRFGNLPVATCWIAPAD